MEESEIGCEHRDCGNKEKVWLPYIYRGLERGLKPHVFCTKCGLVKSASSDKPRRLGYYTNIIAMLGREIKVTKVQMRLISLELERRGIDDIYGIDRHCQEKLFIEVVRQYVNVSEQIINSFLHVG